MRRIYITLHLLLLCLCAHSQHLSFGGIDIDGNVNTFIQKLNKIGFKKDELTKYLTPSSEPGEIENIIGILFGEEVDLYIKYNTRNQLAYQVTAVAFFDTEREALSFLNKAYKNVQESYSYVSPHPRRDSSGEYLNHIICGNRLNGRLVYYGTVVMSYCYYDNSYYAVSIEYKDSKNSK